MEFAEKLHVEIEHSDAYVIARIQKMEFTRKHDFKNWA